jgi:hypothetical protein
VPCSLEADRRFRGVYCLHHQGDEMSVYFNETTQRYMPKAVIFTLAVVRIWNLKKIKLFSVCGVVNLFLELWNSNCLLYTCGKSTVIFGYCGLRLINVYIKPNYTCCHTNMEIYMAHSSSYSILLSSVLSLTEFNFILCS